jgi:hypothetical protein
VDRQGLVTDPTPGKALKSDDRPFDFTPISLAELPDTPTRDRNIAASAWVEAPQVLLTLGQGLDGTPEAAFKRRLHGWLLWRAGPTRGPCRYLALEPGAESGTGAEHYVFELNGEGGATGHGPDGVLHDRFRAWKEALRDHPISQ